VRCGFSDARALQFDHVRGDANSETRYRSNSSKQYYRKVAANSEGKYQLLCANYNWIKRYENNEHGRTRPVGVVMGHFELRVEDSVGDPR
jgi:hypothetical protein